MSEEMPEIKKLLFSFFKPLSRLFQKKLVYIVSTLKAG